VTKDLNGETPVLVQSTSGVGGSANPQVVYAPAINKLNPGNIDPHPGWNLVGT
jgi:hypothetical protein